MRYFISETARILYRAKRNTTGLTDVKIDIWDDNGTKVVSAGTLTELSDGLYYYDFVLPSVGNFIYNITCASQPHDVEGTIVAVGKTSPYWYKPGGGGGFFVTPAKPSKEFLDALEELKHLIKKLSKSMLKDFVKKEDISPLNEIREDLDLLSKLVLRLIPTEDLVNIEHAG